jgi:hypothetical protein
MDLEQVIADAARPEPPPITLPASLRVTVATALAYGVIYVYLWVFWVYGGSFAGAGRIDIGGGRRESS